jgi:mannose-1-phosphate guanylyltransferase
MTNQALVGRVREQLPQLAASQVVGEPCKRDTAPCVGLAALLQMRRHADSVMMVMPSDHVIFPAETFHRAMEHACRIVESDPRQLVTFGIRPSYPAESFGYIERGAAVEAGHLPTFQVAKFHEKPNADVARQYLESGTYYWNAGIFVWKAATLWEQLQEQQPEMAEHLQTIAKAWDRLDGPAIFALEFEQIAGRSIDYAVMEHAPCVTVVEAPFDWDDVGSWQAIARLQSHDAHHNVVAGRYLGIATRSSIIRSTNDHLVVTIGMEDCIVVHTPDATLVARKDQEEAVREAVRRLAEMGWNDVL